MVCLTRWATPASSLTEAPLAMASPPAALISATTFSAASELPPVPSSAPPRSLTTTLAPRRASSRAWQRPSPPPAPVTMATLPAKEMVMADYPLRDLADARCWRGPARLVKPGPQPFRRRLLHPLRQKPAPQGADQDQQCRLQPP